MDFISYSSVNVVDVGKSHSDMMVERNESKTILF